MLARILDPENPKDLRLFQEFRYKYWVEEYKFAPKPSHGKRVERDKYDDHSVHFGVLDRDNRLIGYSRLILPVKNGLQVYGEFEDLIHPHLDPAKDMSESVESSRFVVAHDLGAERFLVPQLLQKLQYQFIKLTGYKYWYQVSEMKLIRRFRRQNYHFSIIGDGKDYQGGICYPAALTVSSAERRLEQEVPEHFSWLQQGVDEMNNYGQLVAGNAAFIAPESQSRIRSTKLLIIGCGLGASIAQLAARLGFIRFTVVDSSSVETIDLNHQPFKYGDLGKNKAVVLQDLLKSINPHIEVEAFTQRLNRPIIERFVRKADLIINNAGFGSPTYAINDLAILYKKPVFFPLNAGFGGFLLVFNERSVRIQEMTDGAFGEVDFIKMLTRSIKGYDISGINASVSSMLGEYQNLGFLAQTCIAENISASLTALAAIGYLEGWPLPIAPYVISQDALSSMRATSNKKRSPVNEAVSKKNIYPRPEVGVHLTR